MEQSLVSEEGELIPRPKVPSAKRPTGNPGARPPLDHEQPLQLVWLDLYGVSCLAWVHFGLTPRSITDLWITTGLGLQTVGGCVRRFRQDQPYFIAQPDFFGPEPLRQGVSRARRWHFERREFKVQEC